MINNFCYKWAIRASSPAAPDLICVRFQVFQSIFGFLGNHWCKLSPSVKKDLADRPLVPVGARLIKAGRLFFRLKVGVEECKHVWVRLFVFRKSSYPGTQVVTSGWAIG